MKHALSGRRKRYPSMASTRQATQAVGKPPPPALAPGTLVVLLTPRRGTVPEGAAALTLRLLVCSGSANLPAAEISSPDGRPPRRSVGVAWGVGTGTDTGVGTGTGTSTGADAITCGVTVDAICWIRPPIGLAASGGSGSEDGGGEGGGGGDGGAGTGRGDGAGGGGGEGGGGTRTDATD